MFYNSILFNAPYTHLQVSRSLLLALLFPSLVAAGVSHLVLHLIRLFSFCPRTFFDESNPATGLPLAKMPKNMGKGGKSFKAGNSKGNMQNQKRDLTYANPDEGEEYAQVKKALGNLRLELQLAGGSTVIGIIRGAMVRKVWIGQGDVVLVAKREFNENDMVDVIHRYFPAEVRLLVKENAIPRDFRSAEDCDSNARTDYVFVNDEEEAQDGDDEQDAIDRNKVFMDDPLARLEDL